MKPKHKPGYLGPAFHAYLEWLEACEHALHTGKDTRLRKKAVTMNSRLWSMPDSSEPAFNKLTLDMLAVDAVLAGVVRSSVKYKVTTDTLRQIGENYTDELVHISHTCPLRLPHEYNTVIVEDFGADDMILVAQEQTADNHQTYPELDLEEDETFICLNLIGYRKYGVELETGEIAPKQQLSHFPVEIHAQWNKVENQTKIIYAGAGGGVEPTQNGLKILDLMWRTFIVWHHQFHLQSLLRHKQIAGARPPKNARPRKLRKKHEHPQFEHTIIQLEVDAPEPGQAGYSVFQPKKRLHQVRGFWRQYRKTGKRVWVKPHWRGDDKLGVVKRDIELITHPQENDDVRMESQGA